MNIPDEAVEALARVIANEALFKADMDGAGWDAEADSSDHFMPSARTKAKRYLEAAAPHMLREARACLGAVLAETQKWVDSEPIKGTEKSQEWYSLGKRHAAEAIRFELREALGSQA